ncbi:hypothetical protein OG226_41215 [Streptomyces sp. NBC_01261]|uniref:hypothetical protein n=1 Tax=Streptomyces sp. NBC_01261 TaxID=2903802 RepID=UPI002E2F85D5|nr:hypothetical protein [Streptomyces sp. NBC_01261]
MVGPLAGQRLAVGVLLAVDAAHREQQATALARHHQRADRVEGFDGPRLNKMVALSKRWPSR